jgi:hypothetical protein
MKQSSFIDGLEQDWNESSPFKNSVKNVKILTVTYGIACVFYIFLCRDGGNSLPTKLVSLATKTKLFHSRLCKRSIIRCYASTSFQNKLSARGQCLDLE